MEYYVDIVLCLDTNSDFYVRMLKSHAPQFWQDLQKALTTKNKYVSGVRVKVIGFRAFEADDEKALEISRYFTLSTPDGTDIEEYKAFMNGLTVDGGGPIPENSLEALALAIQSDWVQTGDRRRHIIVMFTDAPAHKLEEANTSNPNYPADMPTSLAELGDLWNNTSADGNQVSRTKLKQPAKRLIIFAPQEYPWPEIYENWEQVVYNPVFSKEGLDEIIYNDIIESIVGSI